MPVSRNETVFLQTLHVTFNRKDRDVGGGPTQNLVSYRLRTRKRRLKLHHLTVLLLPLCGKRREDRFLQRLLHHRKSVERDVDVATLTRRFWQTTTNQQRQN